MTATPVTSSGTATSIDASTDTSPTSELRAGRIPGSVYPIRLEPIAAFDTLRLAMQRAGFDEETVAKRLGGYTLAGVPRLREGRKTLAGAVEDANAAFIRLFIDGESLSAALVQRLLGDDAHQACIDLGLLNPVAVAETAAEAALVASVILCPIRGLLLVSDRVPLPSEAHNVQPQDYVFSAINELTAHFLDAIPDAPGSDVLELCAGTGVAALLAVLRGARSAVAADLIPRCVHFARFNALLNGMADRVRVVESNAWSALNGETFDLVVAHPPYVPALAHVYDFRDGGGDGESISRAVFEGAAAHLRRGGRMVVRAAFSDRTGSTMAQRVRTWLGDASGEFDLMQLEALEYGPMDAYKSVTKGGRDFIDCERWLRHFQELGIERFAVCIVELRRDAFDRPPVTERRTLKNVITPDVADWHFRWALLQAASGATAEERLNGLAPRVAPGVRLAVHLESDAEGAWRTIGSMVETDWPTHAVVKAPALIPTLLELCDGTRDIDALLAALAQAGLIDSEVGRLEIANLVEVLLAAGAVEHANCPLPPRPTRRV
jgi:methylase of polypeptide subunit release factors